VGGFPVSLIVATTVLQTIQVKEAVMRKRINIIAVAIVLAIFSFAYARYDYSTKNSTTLSNPFGNHESTTVSNPFMDKSLFGDWMKDEVVFAIVVPVGVLAIGFVLAIKK
jgi:hypothetical protein